MGGFPPEDSPPALLSQTALFTSIDANGELVLAEGVLPFEPKYWLWSDGSDKKRWVYLPPDAQIDTSDPDHWVLPVGTKLWKEFSRDGQRIETRLIERFGPGEQDFWFVAYHWQTESDAELVPGEDFLLDANGTSHDIPSERQCHECHHGLPERALGFSALQLDHDLPGVTLQSLNEDGKLTEPVSLGIRVPGDETVERALGYLHANCGNCHNDTGLSVEAVPEPQMYLRVLVGDSTPEATSAYETALNQELTKADNLGLALRIAAGDPDMSAIYVRMSQRYSENQMPPIGTEETDETGLAAVAAWIRSLPPP
jgi:hypothetical protein